jgi:phosphoadenosine phosphosulfate reductase
MNDLNKKERIAIERLRAFEQEEPYHVCYSGGKDSDVIRILAELSGVKYELHHNLTSVDAPETVYYIKSIPGVSIDIPHDKNGNRVSMWSLIEEKKIPPTRLMRYCCSELKEIGGKNRLKVTGVRAAESTARAKNSGVVKIIGKPITVQKQAETLQADIGLTPKGGIIMNMDNSPSRRLVEHCYRTTSTMVNPIVDWSDTDVWTFLHHYGCSGNPLYQCGENRIGCIGCPISGQKNMIRDFEKYPKYKKLYIHAFDRMLMKNKNHVQYTWESGQDVYDWWTGTDSNQMSLFEEE